ncbi:hypothetical protein HK405_016012, partial [Cladochytrium tenue]
MASVIGGVGVRVRAAFVARGPTRWRVAAALHDCTRAFPTRGASSGDGHTGVYAGVAAFHSGSVDHAAWRPLSPCGHTRIPTRCLHAIATLPLLGQSRSPLHPLQPLSAPVEAAAAGSRRYATYLAAGAPRRAATWIGPAAAAAAASAW